MRETGADSTHDTVTVAGRVTLGSGTLSRHQLLAYVQNSRGGIRVSNSAEGPFLQLGDSVQVRGLLRTRRGMREVTDAQVRVFDVPRTALTPTRTDVSELSQRMGTLVTLDVIVTRAWSHVGHPQLGIGQERYDSAATTLATNAALPKVILFEDERGEPPVDLSAFREGDRLAVTGVVAMRDLEGELHLAVVPRLASDVMPRGVTKRQKVGAAKLIALAIGLALVIAAWIRSLRAKAARARALAASESRYERIFAGGPSANFVSTPEGRLVACNANFARLFGFASIEDARAMPLQSLYPQPFDRETMVEELRRTGKLEDRDLKLRRIDGSIVEVQRNAVGHFDERGELTELHGFMVDLTEQRRLEAEIRQAQKMEAVGRLAGGIAHDFNNLLTVILASSDLALETLEPNHEARADIEDVRSAAQRAAQLTGQLLSFSRRQVLQESVVDVGAIVSGLGSMVRRLVGANVEIEVSVPSATRPMLPVFVDPHQLEQALLNLAVNASDSMPSGGALQFSVEEVIIDQAWVSANEAARPGQFCRIQVRDSGSGMDAVTRARAFEPFFTTKEVGKGTGLGLSMVFGFIRQSGGYVTIDSAPHAGTTVSLYLPVTQMTELPAPPRLSGAGAPVAERRGSGAVLIVEDEAQVRAVAARVISALGFDVLVAASAGEAASLALTADSLALVLTDVVMPNGGGLEVAREVGARFPGVPVIFMSGYMEDDEILRSIRTVQHHLINKPFTPASLTAAVLARARSVPAAPERNQSYSQV